MAKAKKLPSGSWRVQVYSHTEEVVCPNGEINKKRIYKSFTCDDPSPQGKRYVEKEAAAWAAEKETRNENGSMRFGQAVSSYIDAKQNVLSPSTIIGYKKISKNYFTDINDKRLEDFNRANVQAWVNTISKNLSPKSVKNAYGLFSAVMSMFLDVQFKVQFPQAKKQTLYIPNDSDVIALLEASQGDLKTAIYLAAYVGLRRGEICALTAQDVHSNYVTINKSMGLKPNRTWEIKEPKTVSSNRDAIIPKFLYEILSQKKDGQIVNMHPDRITEEFGCLVAKLGLNHFRFHDLRHYYVSVNHAIGIPDQYIMAQGGWSTDITMKAVYRNTLSDERTKFATKSAEHFNAMQHEMQHENKKA